AARMGPGYFPRLLGILLILLGRALATRSLWLQGPRISAFKWRPTLLVLLSVVAFGKMLPFAGMVLSTIFLIIASSAASTEFRPKEAVVSSVLLTALAVGVFVIGLKLQLPLWPTVG